MTARVVPAVVALSWPAWLFLLAPSGASAQLTAVGPELQVNTYTTSDQGLPAVAMNRQGDFIVAWTSFGSYGPDTSTAVEAQLFDSDGNVVGPEFQVNAYTTGYQGRAAVAWNDQGQFVVVWQSSGSFGTDSDGYSIAARIFDAGGTPITNDLQVNTETTFDRGPRRCRRQPRAIHRLLDRLPALQRAIDRRSPAARSQRRLPRKPVPAFHRNGAPGRFLAGHRFPGRIVVLFQDDDASPPSRTSLRGRRYDAGGFPLGGEFQVLSYSSWWYNEPSAIQLADGSYVVTWTSGGSNGGDNSGTSIQAHRFAADWQPVGVTFQVNSYTSDWQKRPMVANSPEGGFVISWSSPGSYGPDNRGYSVQVQRYAAGGQPRGSETQVNTYSTSNQVVPQLASDDQGDFVIVWESSGSNGSDTSDTSVQAQRYRDLFLDGFESSDARRWSASQP